MTRSDDDLDNLLRNHFAGELDPVRGDARRAFDREVLRPMRHGLRLRAVLAVGRRVRHVLPMVGAMAACTALGFYVPRWLNAPAGPVAAHELVDAAAAPELADYETAVTVHHEDRGPADLPDGRPGRRVWQSRIESARFVDPQTHARTEYFLFPAGSETVVPADRQ